ncbi:hypothetical protein LWI28_017709 [Acer negundo]|uniref:Uncharacterized protein n=1 Tax=Acer negundo TaxID=4023 RepID=A0AAD5NW11_ACENE|nr:hypothetical protein LWI28_017709 [Acer negundo]
MSHLPGKQPPPWRTRAQHKYQEEVSNLGYELGCDMAITADAEILGDPDWCSRLSIQNGKNNGQFLTVNG